MFSFYETHGLPLDIILDRLRQDGLQPDWEHLYEGMLEAGWHPDRTFRRLQQLVGDVYGPEFRKRWEKIMSGRTNDSEAG